MVQTNAKTNTGHYIRIERIKAGMSQRQLASSVGVTPSAVAQWETNSEKSGNITVANLLKVAQALNIPPGILFGETIITDEIEIALIRLLQQVTPEQRSAFIKILSISAELCRR